MNKAKAVERLVQRLEADLAERATVEHDVHLTETVSGRKRQVDVLVTLKDGYRQDRWAYEVKYQRRPVGPEIVEQWITRQHDLNVQRVVIVSSSGFTDGAKQKASQHGILLHTLQEALHTRVELVAPLVKSFRTHASNFRITPQIEILTDNGQHALSGEAMSLSIAGGPLRPALPAFHELVTAELNRQLRSKEIELGWDEKPRDITVKVPVDNVRLVVEGAVEARLLALTAEITVQIKATDVAVPTKRWTYQTEGDGPRHEVFMMDLNPILPNHSMEISLESLPDGSWRVCRIGPADPALLDKAK